MADLRTSGSEWEARQQTQNRRKRGVSFSEAETVFLDEHALLVDDPDHSAEQDRVALLGLSARLRTLVVVHCYRSGTLSSESSRPGRQPGRGHLQPEVENMKKARRAVRCHPTFWRR
jgi:uncharacterized protein